MEVDSQHYLNTRQTIFQTLEIILNNKNHMGNTLPSIFLLSN